MKSIYREGIHIFKPYLINEQIVTKEVRLIGENGEQLGILPLYKAREIAKEKDLDIVLISSSSLPYVCKIMDYGKFKFETIKKEKEMKKNQNISELKEIQLSMTIDIHDIETKARHANKFLQMGDKVKIVLRMKGRQQAYSVNGIKIVKDFQDRLSQNGIPDKEPEIIGRNIVSIITPKK